VAPSNGSDFCEANPFMREFITGLVHYVSSALEVTDFKGIYDPHLDHFHIYKEDNETIMQGVLRVLNSDYMDHHDNALDDLWVDRATWMNKELQLQPNIYYQLYYGCTTDIGKAIGDNIPNDRQWLLFRPMSANMGKLDTTTKGSFLDGFGDTLTTINVPAQRLGREWQPNDGMVNMVLNCFGLESVDFINGPYWAKMLVLCVYTVWVVMPFKILILTSALASVNKNYYNAARVDGTSDFRIFTKITLPMISPTLFYLIVTGFIGAFKAYSDAVAIFGTDLNNAGMNTIVGYVYDMLYSEGGGYPSYASAAAIILFVIVLTITCINLMISKKHVHY
jgi:hypothetical protein